MNLVILIPTFPPGPTGGSELQAQSWAERLGLRHHVTVITTREDVAATQYEVRERYALVRLRTPILAIWRTISEIASVHRYISTMTPRPDLVLCFMVFNSGLAGVVSGRRLKIPVVVWIRGETEYRLHDSWRYRILSPRVWSGAAGVLVQSEAGKTDLLRELEQVAPDRILDLKGKLKVIGNGIELPEISQRPVNGPVVSVGRLIPEKGMNIVIEACAAAGRPLVIVGKGPELGALKTQAAALSADVHFAGFLDREALTAIYREASVVVLASRREGLPNVVIEAMSHGRPVVATPCAGTRSLITDNENGLLIPFDDATALESALRRLETEPETAERLGAAGRATVSRFEWERIQPVLESALERFRFGTDAH